MRHTTTAEWLKFYFEGLRYIVELNKNGQPFVESYAAMILTKMLTPFETGYVDLMSPAGIGIGAVVYNYDGDVYASDESRMLAEMGDKTFCMGNVHRDRYEELFGSDALLAPLEESFAASAPDVQRLRIRAVLWRRPRLPLRHPGRLCRTEAAVGLLREEHGDLPHADQA